MRSFNLENLESRRLLSATAGVDALLLEATPVFVTADATPTFVLPGPFTGVFVKPVTNPDAGALYRFAGSGSNGHGGTVEFQGHLRLPGNVAQGQSQGDFTLTFADKKTVTLHVHGPTEAGFGALPDHLHYTVTASTKTGFNVGRTGGLLLSHSIGHHFDITFRT